jgi:Fe-S-cluster containining protein
MPTSLPVLNLAEAKFECIFGRGCDGICCQNGRPGVYPEEEERIRKNQRKFLPELRPSARAVVERDGFVSNRRKGGLPMLRVVDGWCVFFNQGCVLHKVGAAEGDKYRYKPAPCGLFPLTKSESGDWYVRQHGEEGEEWDLFCLNPAASPQPAAVSLAEEIGLAERYEAEAAKAARKAAKKPAAAKKA